MKNLISMFAIVAMLVAGQGFAKDAKKAAPAAAAKPAAAAAPSTGGGYQAPYGMAGCGLGSLVIKNNSTWPQVFAVTLNATGYQSSAITSGTSNCVDGRSESAAVEQEVFMTANLAALTKESAQGNGEMLSTFADVLGCGADSQGLFNQISQDNHGAIFSSSEPKVVLDNYLGVIRSNDVLKGSCIRAS